MEKRLANRESLTIIVLLCVDRFTFKSVYKRGISSLHFSRGPDFRGVGDVEPNVTVNYLHCKGTRYLGTLDIHLAFI